MRGSKVSLRSAIAILTVSLAVVACESDVNPGPGAQISYGSPGPPPGAEGQTVTVPTSCWPGCGGPVMTALVGGVLAGSATVDGGCLWLIQLRPPSAAGVPARRMPVIWPAGFKAHFAPVELLDATGKVVARAGDRVEFGGGLGPVNRSGRCMLDRPDAAIVESPIHVS